MGEVIAYVQAGGFGTRLAPFLHQPGFNSRKILSQNGRNILPFNHNSYYAVAKPVMPYFGTSLSEPLIRSAVRAGVHDIRLTVHNMPETVIAYYRGKQLECGVAVNKFLYEYIPLDTSGGIVRDVVAGMRDGSIKPQDTILVLGGDIRTDVNIADFLDQHAKSNADISIALASVPREEMHRFGAVLRQGDATPVLGQVELKKGPFDVYGELSLNPDKMARILKFFEKLPKFDPGTIISPGGLDIQDIMAKHGVGALSPTNLQNGSVYAIRAELVYQLAPLVFNLTHDATARQWAETEDINITGAGKFTDFGGDWFMKLTGSKPLPPFPKFPTQDEPPITEEQRRVIEAQQQILDDLQKGLPQIFGFKHDGNWSDDGTMAAVLQGHFDILRDLVANGEQAGWPIAWCDVKKGYPQGVITMSHIDNLSRIKLTPPVYIGHNVTIRDGAEIGPYAVISRGWEISGRVERSVLFPKKQIDAEIEGDRGWRRFRIPANYTIVGSIIGSGLELTAINDKGNPIDMSEITGKIVVSNGSQNVISPIEL